MRLDSGGAGLAIPGKYDYHTAPEAVAPRAPTLVLDEVQRVTHLFIAIKRAVDRDRLSRPGRPVFGASCSPRLCGSGATFSKTQNTSEPAGGSGAAWRFPGTGP
jgi:hypothetical protein